MTVSPGKPKVLIDCDPGVDDAIALLVACRLLDVVAVTTVAGNVGVDQATSNALGLLDLIGLDTAVAQGMDRPWIAPAQDAKDIHGHTGLGGVQLSHHGRRAVQIHAVQLIIETIRANPGITVVCLGPLTNLATAMRLDPDIVDKIGRLCIMGGSTTHGNVTPAAEFNIHFDPEAAHVVLTSGPPISMTGLNVTEQMLVKDSHIRQLYESSKSVAGFCAQILESHIQRMVKLFGLHAAVLHDPAALAPIIAPHLITMQKTDLQVELTGSQTRGMTVCDFRLEASPIGESNIEVATNIDAVPLMDLLLATLTSYP